MITTNTETLRTKSSDFTGTPEELKSLFNVLEFELFNAPSKDGVGLSGIQVNVPIRVAIVRTKTTRLNIYNAKITATEQPFTFQGEGCLSVPGVKCSTTRFNIITVTNGDGVETKHSGFDAVVIQHEIGHWDGEIFTDHKIEE